MSGFLGSYLHQLDSKGRLSLPAAFRRGSDSESFVVIQFHEDALSLYPAEAWSPVRERLLELRERRPDLRPHVLRLTANAHKVVPDAQGRVLIPDRLRESVGLDSEALVVGALDKIEVWNPERFEERTAEAEEDFSDIAASIFA